MLRIWNCLHRIQLNNFIRAKSKWLIPYQTRFESYFLPLLLQNTGVPDAIHPSRFLKELPAEDTEYYPLGTQAKTSEEQYKSDIDEALKQLESIL